MEGEVGERPIDEMVRRAAATTIPAPRMTMREQIEHDKRERTKREARR